MNGAAAYNGIGDQLKHTFLKYDAFSLTESEAVAAGWQKFDASVGCVPSLGVPYVAATPTDHHPLVAYYSAGGQISAIGAIVFGDLEPTLIEAGFFLPWNEKSHKIHLGFREPSSVCDPSTSYNEPVGDRVVVNPDSISLEIPLTRSGALAKGFFTGGCIGGMGVHHSLDLNSYGKPTWNHSSLMPFTPMYDETSGNLNAVLLQTSSLQEGVPFVGDWEGPFVNSLLCQNYCDSRCPKMLANSVGTAHLWNTCHFLFHDHSLNKCSTHCPFGYTG